jgi:hypothetical protein
MPIGIRSSRFGRPRASTARSVAELLTVTAEALRTARRLAARSAAWSRAKTSPPCTVATTGTFRVASAATTPWGSSQWACTAS